MHSRMDVAGAGGGQRVGVFIRVPEAPGHLDAAPGDAEVLEVVVDDLRVDASVLQAEVSAESIEDLAGMRGVEGDSDGVLVDLAGHFEGEAVLAGLAGSGFADEDGEQDPEVVAALAAVVADDDQGRLVEGHLDLAGAGREARALGGGAQVFIGVGWQFIHPANYHPYIPKNTGEFGHFGLSGIMMGAGTIFFAYIGFDAV